VRGQWEERYERRCGFWRSFVDGQVLRYLDCGLYENGFARIRCPECAAEYLLAFSCKTRELCPSCGSEMKVIAFITEHDVVDAILRHLKRKEERRERAPPS
jgi:ribosomal protein S27E